MILISSARGQGLTSPTERQALGTLLLGCVPGLHVRRGHPRLPRGAPGLYARAHERAVRPRRVRPRELDRDAAVPVRLRRALLSHLLLEHRAQPRSGALLPLPGHPVPGGVHRGVPGASSPWPSGHLPC